MGKCYSISQDACRGGGGGGGGVFVCSGLHAESRLKFDVKSACPVAQIAVMHTYVDQESYAGMTIDAALRELLKGFRLPGTVAETQ